MDDERAINWSALEDLYPLQVARDPLEWRFLIYGKIENHDDACYLEFLARNSKTIIGILKEWQGEHG